MKHKAFVKAVKQETWTARMNVKYHGVIAERCRRRVRYACVFSAGVAALVAVAAVSLLAVAGQPQAVILVVVGGLAVLSAASAVATMASYRLTGTLALHGGLRQRHMGLRFDLEALLVDLRSHESGEVPDRLLKGHQHLMARRREIERAEPPPVRGLLRDAQNEVLTELGLSTA